MPAIANLDTGSHNTTGNSGNYRGFAQSIEDDIHSVTLGAKNNSNSNSDDQVWKIFFAFPKRSIKIIKKI